MFFRVDKPNMSCLISFVLTSAWLALHPNLQYTYFVKGNNPFTQCGNFFDAFLVGWWEGRPYSKLYMFFFSSSISFLGGGFKYVFCSPQGKGRFPFWLIFFRWVGSTTNQFPFTKGHVQSFLDDWGSWRSRSKGPPELWKTGLEGWGGLGVGRFEPQWKVRAQMVGLVSVWWWNPTQFF